MYSLMARVRQKMRRRGIMVRFKAPSQGCRLPPWAETSTLKTRSKMSSKVVSVVKNVTRVVPMANSI
jgi:hypothetical protein